jgi:hypothetical protein
MTMNSDRPHSNPEQACFALGCSLNAYIAGVGAGRDDLIREQDARDYVVMCNAQGAYRQWLVYPGLEIEIRGPRPPTMSSLQHEFEDWARCEGLNIQRFRWESNYADPSARWAWRAWQARGAHSNGYEQK